jgi:tRNA delta(2)-isopentenylpyrophosphate transferase
VDDLDFPGTDPETRRDLEAEAAVVGAAGLHERLTATDPAAAAKIEPGNVRRTVRALEVAELTGQPFSSFAEGWEVYGPGRVRAAGISMPASVSRTRIEDRVAEMLERGWLDEVEDWSSAGSVPGSPRPRPSGTLSWPVTSPASSRSTRRSRAR